VALLEGLAALTSAFDSEFGDLIGSVGSKLVSGDFAGAWNDVVTQMATVWDRFAAGIVTSFTGAAKAITKTIKEAIDGIANWLLRKSAEGGIMGSIVSKALGVDMSEEQAKAELAEMKRQAVARRNLEYQRDAAKAWLEGTATGQQASYLKTAGVRGDRGATEALLTRTEQELTALETGEPVDVLRDARDAVDQFTSGTADAVEEYLNEIEKTAEDRVKEAEQALREATGAGTDQASEALEDARRQLDELRAIAEAAKPATARPGTETEQPGTTSGSPAIATPRQAASVQLTATYSAARAQVAGFGGGETPQQQMVDRMEYLAKLWEAADQKFGEIVDATQDTAIQVLRLTGSLTHG